MACSKANKIHVASRTALINVADLFSASLLIASTYSRIDLAFSQAAMSAVEGPSCFLDKSSFAILICREFCRQGDSSVSDLPVRIAQIWNRKGLM
jgi:hypothetical protein